MEFVRPAQDGLGGSRSFQARPQGSLEQLAQNNEQAHQVKASQQQA